MRFNCLRMSMITAQVNAFAAVQYILYMVCVCLKYMQCLNDH